MQKEYPVYSMKAIAPTLATILGVEEGIKAEEKALDQLVAYFADTEKMAVLAIDALGWHTYQKHLDQIPVLTKIRQVEKNFALLRSILPSITPVNFACMITGREVAGHGIRAKENDLQSEDLFTALRQAGKTSAGLGRVGYTGSDLLGRYADFRADGAEDDLELERILLDLATSHQPDFMIMQHGLVDDMSHAKGPYSDEAGQAVAAAGSFLDRSIRQLKQLGYGIIVLADHGQHEYKREDGSTGGSHGTEFEEDCLVSLAWTK